MDIQTFPIRLKQYRLAAGMTQRDLSAASNVPQPSITRMELGTREPMLSTALALAEALGVSVYDLVAPIEPEPKTPAKGRKKD